jgi:hypothetical protein
VDFLLERVNMWINALRTALPFAGAIAGTMGVAKVLKDTNGTGPARPMSREQQEAHERLTVHNPLYKDGMGNPLAHPLVANGAQNMQAQLMAQIREEAEKKKKEREQAIPTYTPPLSNIKK